MQIKNVVAKQSYNTVPKDPPISFYKMMKLIAKYLNFFKELYDFFQIAPHSIANKKCRWKAKLQHRPQRPPISFYKMMKLIQKYLNFLRKLKRKRHLLGNKQEMHILNSIKEYFLL